jgi:hypothetical protein
VALESSQSIRRATMLFGCSVIFVIVVDLAACGENELQDERVIDSFCEV